MSGDKAEGSLVRSPQGQLSGNAVYAVPLPPHLFLQTGKSGIAYDDVVQQIDIEELSRLHELPGSLDILRTARGVRAGVIVRDNNAGAIAHNRLTKHLC
jgi:hypothetical protein